VTTVVLHDTPLQISSKADDVSRNQLHIAGLVCAAVALSDTEPATPRLFETAAARTMRGDWETPDALVVAYTNNWPDELAQVVSAANAATAVLVLSNPLETPELDEWRRAYAVPESANVLATDVETPWVRDYGPLQALEPDGAPVWLDAAFDRGRPGDVTATLLLAARFGVKLETSLVPLDGGALIADGAGLCAATEATLSALPVDLHDDDFVRAALAQLGCRVLVAVPALSGEETHHIDMLAQFLSRDSVAVASLPSDPIDGPRLDLAARALRAGAERLGRELHVARIPMARLSEHAYRTYVNGVRTGAAYLVPRYRDVDPEIEAAAHAALAAAMPEITLAPIDADEMIARGGALHCTTLGIRWRGAQRAAR
jgi:agmatine deiminase